MKQLLTVAFLLGLVFNTVAQTPPVPEPSNEVLQSCILGTHSGTWASLTLTTDQLERVKRIQEACMEECAVATAKKRPASTITNADGTTVVSELKNVLSHDQYHKWLAWCAESTKTTEPAK